LTDPAEEFAALCVSLRGGTNQTGAQWLADRFETDPWSKEFYQVLFAIVERGHYLIELVENLDGAEHIKSHVQTNLKHILGAFNAQSLNANWKQVSQNSLGQDNVGPIAILSAVVRPNVCYPMLDEAERSEVLDLTHNLLEWLSDHQLSEQDFIRQALIDGLTEFNFRLQRVEWLGFGYTLEGLRDVIGAYFALERGHNDEVEMPLVGATLKKVSEGLSKIYEKAGVAKDATETADFLLRAYGAAALYTNGNAGGVAGLLTFGA
jgi:hypothetical protein